MKRLLLALLIFPLACADAGQNGKLILFGSEQHTPGVGNFSQNGGYPDPLWKPISQGAATGNQFPANWWRDDFSFNDYVWNAYRGTDTWTNFIKTVTDYCKANGINGPTIQLHYGNFGGFNDAQTFIAYLQTFVPYLAAGSYEICANEVLGAPGNPTPDVENPDSLLNALGGAGATGYDGLIALIKIIRQVLPNVLLGINDTQIVNSDDGRPIGLYHQAEVIRVYKLLADNGAALDWLGCEGYGENTQFQPGSDGFSQVKAAIDTVGAALVTTKGTGAPNTIAFTEFTPGGGYCGGGGQYSTQKACWQAYLTMFAADQYVFGVTGPWEGFRRSNGFSNDNWFYDDTDKGGNDPDCVASSNGHIPPSLAWLQGFIPTVISGGTPTPTPTPGPSPSPSPCTPSSSGSTITNGGGALIDQDCNTWTIVNGVIFENGSPAGYSLGVIQLAYAGGKIWQENNQQLWWSWGGNGVWNPSSGTTVNPLIGPGGGPSPTPSPTPGPINFSKWQAALENAIQAWIMANPPTPN